MKILIVCSAVIAALAALIAYANWRLHALPSKEKKALVKKTINGVFVWFEERGLLPRTPAFNREYLRDYPALKILEDNAEAVRAECLALLEIKERLTDICELGGSYTQVGIHRAGWKTFVFKSGEFIESNCQLCPRTSDMLRTIPGLYTAFFSVLEPRQRVLPHWGYYKGFQRYHLGVVIPHDNANRDCYLRVNDDPYQNSLDDLSLVEKGETYYWKNGEGIVFDDNYLHEAANGSDEVRVILWLDLKRKMPWYIQAFNTLCLALVYRDESVKRFRQNSIVEHDGWLHPARARDERLSSELRSGGSPSSQREKSSRRDEANQG